MHTKHCLTVIAAVCMVLAAAGALQGNESSTAPHIGYSVKMLTLPADWSDATPVYASPELTYVYNQHAYRCTECHDDLLSPPKKTHLPFGAHRDMIFDHGLNMRCLNCHHLTRPDAYIDHDGSEISRDTPVLLCRKCHGVTDRDWEARVHGRINGYWDASVGPVRNLACNQCHNPHHPRFPSLRPMPPPVPPNLVPHSREDRHD